MARTGRRPGDSDTSRRILQAAREAFGEVGYDRATIRSIAAAAEVDPALVHHYFGPKEDLYAAAIDIPFSARAVVETIVAGGTEGAGERMTRLFFTVWEEPEARQPLLAMIRGALVGNVQGTEAFRQFIEHELLARVAPLLEGTDRELRVAAAAGHLVGVAVARYVIGIGALASADVDDLVGLIGPRIQSYIDSTETG
jgi:AcrR family transcriptional regulator